MISMNVRDIAISKMKDVDYRRIISVINKSEAINLMQNTGLTEKRWIHYKT